jgi:DNA-binding PadR family transcriptional regulator
MKTLDLRVIILKMFKGKEFYGYEIHKALASEGIHIKIGRLYRVLIDMLHEGLLRSHREKSRKGPMRRLHKVGRVHGCS